MSGSPLQQALVDDSSPFSTAGAILQQNMKTSVSGSKVMDIKTLYHTEKVLEKYLVNVLVLLHNKMVPRTTESFFHN